MRACPILHSIPRWEQAAGRVRGVGFRFACQRQLSSMPTCCKQETVTTAERRTSSRDSHVAHLRCVPLRNPRITALLRATRCTSPVLEKYRWLERARAQRQLCSLRAPHVPETHESRGNERLPQRHQVFKYFLFVRPQRPIEPGCRESIQHLLVKPSAPARCAIFSASPDFYAAYPTGV